MFEGLKSTPAQTYQTAKKDVEKIKNIIELLYHNEQAHAVISDFVTEYHKTASPQQIAHLLGETLGIAAPFAIIAFLLAIFTWGAGDAAEAGALTASLGGEASEGVAKTIFAEANQISKTLDELSKVREVKDAELDRVHVVKNTRAFGDKSGHIYARRLLPGGSGKALAGHGVMESREMLLGNGEVIIPEGTTLITPRNGIAIKDATGQLLESVKSVDELDHALKTGVTPNGTSLTRDHYDDLRGYMVYHSGEKAPNFTLLPAARDLVIYQNSTTVDKPTMLKDLLKKNLGCVFWGACTTPIDYIPR